MVKLKLDVENRENLRKLHTATHIINYCAKTILGEHVWQNGSNLTFEYGTLDITHYKNIEEDEIEKIENLANSIVFENRPVEIETLSREKAEQKYSFTIYQGGAIPSTDLRIIKIKDSDIEACGGLHTKNTGEIGIIKIENTQKIQDGLIRLKYKVRNNALKLINQKDKVIKNLEEFYRVKFDDLEKTSIKFFETSKEEVKKNEKFEKFLKDDFSKILKNSNQNEINFPFNLNLNTLCEIYEKSENQNLILKSTNFVISKNNLEISFKKIIDKKKYKVFIL